MSRSQGLASAHYALLALIVLYAVIVRGVLLDVPFHETPEGCGSFYGILARNYLRLPWSVTRGVPVQNTGYRAGVPVKFYSHHPPLAPLLIAGSYKLLGMGDWQTRLVPAMCSVGTVVLLYGLLRRWGRPRAGLLAAALYAAIPMVVYYGGQPELLNAQFAFFLLLSSAAFLRFERCPSLSNLALLCGTFTLAALTDWPAFYLAPVAVAYWLCRRRLSGLHWIAAFGIYAAALFFLIYAHIVLVDTHDWKWMLANLRARAIGDSKSGSFTLLSWFSAAADYNLTYHTIPVLLLALRWILVRSWRRLDAGGELTRFMFIVGVLHVLVGRQGCYAHAWWWWPLTPPIVLAAALTLDEAFTAWMRRQPDEGRAGRRAGVELVAGIVAFAALSAWAMLPRLLYVKYTDTGQYWSGVRIAQAVKAASPHPGATVLVVSGDSEPSLWYYADCPLVLGVWSVEELKDRMKAGIADLPFGFQQEWPDAPVAAVFPRNYAKDAPGLLKFLRDNARPIDAPAELAKQYFLFDLRDVKMR